MSSSGAKVLVPDLVAKKDKKDKKGKEDKEGNKATYGVVWSDFFSLWWIPRFRLTGLQPV